MFNIMDLFRANPANGVPAAAPAVNAPPSGQPNANGGLPGTQVTNNTAPNGVVPTQPVAEPTPLSELEAKYKDIWTPVKVEGDPNLADSFKALDPAKVMETAKTMDFSRAVTPELMAKVAAGGQDAVAALGQIINGLGQTVSGQQTVVAGKLIEQALEAQRADIMRQLPTLVRQHAVGDSLQGLNPALSNPALAPMVDAMKAQAIAKNPTASAAEISKYVNGYFESLGAVFAPKVPDAPEVVAAKARQAQDFDFSKFITTNPQ